MKKAKEVNQARLEQAIELVEQKATFRTQSELWEAAAAEYNSLDVPEEISAAVVRLRAKQWSIKVKTEPARKVTPKAERTPERTEPNPTGEETLDKLLARTPKKYRGLARKAHAGSKAWAVKLKCLDCSSYQTQEVKYCPVIACPLWPVRPYRSGAADKQALKQDQPQEQEGS
jgi:hypothetical protein